MVPGLRPEQFAGVFATTVEGNQVGGTVNVYEGNLKLTLLQLADMYWELKAKIARGEFNNREDCFDECPDDTWEWGRALGECEGKIALLEQIMPAGFFFGPL